MPPTTPPAPRRPTPAQWGRTLAVGTVAGTLHLPRLVRPCGHPRDPLGPSREARPRTQPHPVQHLTDAWGGLLLLVDDDSALHGHLEALTADARWNGVPVVLDVLDVPPGQAALPRARLSVTGWVESILPADQRRVAQTAAAVRPLGALLDVGTSRSVWRLEVADVRVTTAEGVHLVPDEEFTTAAPDPLYDDEDALVTRLETAHRDALVGWVLDTLPPHEAQQTREVAVVGVDRYGLDVLVTAGSGTKTLRASFTEPVHTPHDVVRALCGIFGCPCRATGLGEHTHEGA
ncbi:DUF2470 domain-containing protein [Kineococcus sp. TBRC 1896]|uniref:DUF2470 domain-containing protein n=1 Tax=Kineococcus mangrovi TaxID=1660183 RepID=A0ABV4HWW1_9ACTN